MSRKSDTGQYSLGDYQLQEVTVRLCLKEGAVLYSTAPLSHPEAARDVMRDVLKDLDREMVCVVNLDNKMKPINYNVVSIGSIDQSMVPIQNVYKSSILSNAASIMLLHNHPSGDVSPSSPDFDVTKKLVEAGKLMGIPVIDHLIIGGMNGDIYSFRTENPELFTGAPDLEFIRNNVVAEATVQFGGREHMEKMSYEEFKAWAADEIRAWLPPEYADADVSIHRMEKLGLAYDGMTVVRSGQRAAAAVNLTAFYDMYQEGRTAGDIIHEMADVAVMQAPQMEYSVFSDYEAAKDRLFIRVANKETNADVLAGMPHKEVEDLAITYHVLVNHDQNGIASAPVTDDLLRHYGVTAEQLHEDAIANSQRMLPAQLDSMQNMLFGMMTPGASDTLRDEPYPGSTMLVLTNNVQLNGAAALFYPGVMDQAAERLGGNFIVLPSSTHEVIMIPADGMTDFRSLEQMVKDINRSQVAPEERLSDHVYHYDAQERLFERADRHEMRKELENRPQEKASILKRLAEKKEEAKMLNDKRPTHHNRSSELDL
jgi:DNA repair proteins